MKLIAGSRHGFGCHVIKEGRKEEGSRSRPRLRPAGAPPGGGKEEGRKEGGRS